MSLPIDTARTSDPDTVPQVAPRSAAAPHDRAGTPADPTEDVADLDRAMREFSEIGGTLVEAYGALAERAERVEGELARTNRALEEKVRELDEVTRHLEAILEAETEAARRYTDRAEQAEKLGHKGLQVQLEDMVRDETEHRDETARILRDWPI